MSTPTLETHEELEDYGIGTRSVRGAKFQRQGGCNHGLITTVPILYHI